MNPTTTPYVSTAPTMIDSLANDVSQTLSQTGPALRSLATDAEMAARQGIDKVRDQARQAANSARGYVQDEPVKSILIAAAMGAALMALLTLVSRARH